ncbi:FAD/NAD(P)-binding domain-containing protein [Aspergillus heteromorphus CBS 117.55]|uniref:FAD/NAD(P)-binding domain-containing protein n=1 Tax=Aspergillus heteromorphus CBS 117.55 TaxID=1448321 RepID=A0A317X2B7_9EURO|nr:FAD/NAD(P)-binding domain-containing protein [Aspergillus heteromorphus CBS 117.55]PWY92291.1 FAD/NAD(P)-binding domain-containing protein [Aspergillus heteromorphus CBS 117.55]
MAQESFKVLIAGGSLVGLTLALVLEQAGIDYELFEKGDLAPQLGASIGLHPHSLRILDQLGVWPDIEKTIIPLHYRYHFDENGRCMEESRVLQDIHQILTYPIIFMERCEALRIVHSHIANPSKLHAHNGVVAYDETTDGVVVTTADGNPHRGDILIGADGIHSRVRQLMAEKIHQTDRVASEKITKAFTSEYKCIFAVSRNDPASPFLPDATVHNVYHSQHSAVAASGVSGLVFWFLFVKTPLTTTPSCPRFTDDDANRLIEEYATVAPGPGYTIKDLWEARVKGSLVPLEEGIVPQWSHGRVQLLGDAIHKVTINAGLGGNLAFEGISHFSNSLTSLLQQSPSPSLEQLTSLFQNFERTHRPRATTVLGVSGQITRYEAQDTGFLKFAAKHLSPWVPDIWKAKLYASFSNGAPHLDFLPLKEQEAVQRSAMTSTGYLYPGLVLTGAAVVAGAAVVWRGFRLSDATLS